MIVLLVIVGCALSAIFGWAISVRHYHEALLLQEQRVWDKAFETGKRVGYKKGYDTGYSAPVRRILLTDGSEDT